MSRRNKYNARKVKRFGMVFDSALEADRYIFLRAAQDAGEISELRTQQSYEVLPAFRDRDGKKNRAIKYIVDFEYILDGQVVIEDVKGYQTEVNKIKVKLFKREYQDFVFRLVRSATERIT